MSIDEKEEPERFKIIGKGFIDHPRGARLRRPGGQTDGKLHFDALEAINATINTHCKFLSIHKYLDSPAATQFNKHPFRGSRASGFLHLFPAPITRQDDMRSFTAAFVVLALLAAPLACQASSQGRELKQDLSAITSLIGSSGLPNIGGGSGFDISTITSALSGIAGSGGGLTSLASNIGGGGSPNPLGGIVSSVGGRKMLSE